MMDQVIRLLESQFPGGEFRKESIPAPAGHSSFVFNFSNGTVGRHQGASSVYRIGPHLIYPREVAGNLVLEWRLAGWRDGDRWKTETNIGIQEDLMIVENGLNDIIGWVSYVKKSILQQAGSQLACILSPHDTFPLGVPKYLEGIRQLAPPLKTFAACGVSPDSEMLHPLLPAPIKWADGANGTRFAFKVKTALGGLVGGRFGDIHSLTGSPILEWALKIPITILREPTEVINQKGNITDDTVIPDVAAAKLWLEKKYLDEMIKWSISRNQKNDPWA